MNFKDLRYMLIILISTVLIGCQSGGVKQSQSLQKDLYARAQHFLEKGDVMRARDALHALKNTHEKYPEAMALLKKTVEPLRLKMLRNKKKEGADARRKGHWQQALNAYLHAADLALDDSDLEQKITKMQVKIQQSRFDSLLKKRTQEDKALRKSKLFYAMPPKALAKDDQAFILHQKRMENQMQAYLAASLQQANVFLKEGYPEAAYVEMLSYLSFKPKLNKTSQRLFAKIKQSMPISIRIPGVNKTQNHTRKNKPARIKEPKITTAMIDAYILQEEWMKANSAATLFKQQGGKSDAYLALILKKRQQLAQQAYELGRQAFLQEKLGSAVAHWQVAVHLMPNNKEYRQSLGRASRLQKRLKSINSN